MEAGLPARQNNDDCFALGMVARVTQSYLFGGIVVKKLYLVLLSLILACPVAMANDGPLKSHMEAFTVTVMDDGKEQLTVADVAIPGSIIEYQLTYENSGDTPLAGLAVTGPVPTSVEYLGDSAKSESASDLQVSIDQGKSWHNEPVIRIAVDEYGVSREEIVPTSQYTHIRWTAVAPLASNSTSTYAYRVRVNNE